MNHSEMDDLYELYLLGILEPAECAEISSHLGEKCGYCEQRLRESSDLIREVSNMIDITPPPPGLRQRVLSLVTPVRSKRYGWHLAFALAATAIVATLLWSLHQRSELEEVQRQRDELRSALAILSASDTKTVSFGRNEGEPQGRVFVGGNGGVVFLGNHLPLLQAGKTFEFWMIPPKGNPVASGLFKADGQGTAVTVLAKSIKAAEYAAVAVSVEPLDGSSQPTTTPILIVPLG